MTITDKLEFRSPVHTGIEDPDNDLNFSYKHFFEPGIKASVLDLTSEYNRRTKKGPPEGEWPESRYAFFKKGFEDPDMQIIMHNGERVGCFCISITDEAIILQRVYLQPDYQRQGIGQKLVEMALAKAHELKRPLELEVLENNGAAINSYKKSGFVRTSETIVNGWNRKFEMRHKDTVQYISSVSLEKQYMSIFNKAVQEGVDTFKMFFGRKPALSHICFKFTSAASYQNHVAAAQDIGTVTQQQFKGKEITWCKLDTPLEKDGVKLEWLELVEPREDTHDIDGVSSLGYVVPDLDETIKMSSHDGRFKFRYQSRHAAEMAVSN